MLTILVNFIIKIHTIKSTHKKLVSIGTHLVDLQYLFCAFYFYFFLLITGWGTYCSY